MLKSVFVGAVGVGLAALLLVGDALAQRDAGAKMRGEFGRGFRSSSGARSTTSGPSYVRRPAAAPSAPIMAGSPALPGPSGPMVAGGPALGADQEYRLFSFEPISVQPGDRVAVSGNDARVMRGATVVGVLPNGYEFPVTGVQNGWLGTVVEMNGQTINGWVWHQNVASSGP